MTANTPRHPLTEARVACTIPGMDSVTVRRDVPYRGSDDGSLTMDLYYPSESREALPAVLLVTGYSDPGAQQVLGARFKEIGPFVSWAQLIAASGLVAVTYTNSTPADVDHVWRHLQEHGPALGIDVNRLGVWTSSGHGPNALSFLMERGDGVRCAVLAYPYTLDDQGSTHVADAARQFRFVTPAAGKFIDRLPPSVPLLVVRAGRDEMPGLNAALDRFVSAALTTNLPITVINHATGPHAFDLFDQSRAAHEIVEYMLAFLRSHLVQ